MKKKSVAVVIITNGPGELSTWVKPVIDNLKKINESLKQNDLFDVSLRLVLVPCPNSTGKECEVAKSWRQFELVTEAKNFWKLIIRPSSYTNWPEKRIVVFLGGDQFWSVLLSKRLGYMNITYAEWVARWPRWCNTIAAMNEDVKNSLNPKFKHKCEVIGDLMADTKNNQNISLSHTKNPWIALLPGSKKAKLSVGIPYFLEIADNISQKNKNINLLIPIAPTTSTNEFKFFQSKKNPIANHYSSKIKRIKNLENSIFDYVLQTSKNTKIYLIKKHPCYDILKKCDLAITTVGANTAELASLILPMVVVLPTQHLNVMQSWDGILGIIGKISFINRLFTSIIKNWFLKNKKFFSWPNIKAKKFIVPERIGNISPKQIAKEAIFLINNKEYLREQKYNLSKQRGQTGAAKKLAHIIFNSIKKLN